ncbi:MAG: UbiA prenyltransferase family protein [Promethearchaeota archaeon]|jgi:4-hydroxybenzoate polyprenyltransferase
MQAQSVTTFEQVNENKQRVQETSIKRFDKQFMVYLLKLARPRTWFFIYYSYIIGWLLSGAQISIQFIIGFLICILSTANVNLLNAYTDIEEDQINLPNRVIMVDKVGLKNLRNIVLLIYVATSVIALVMPFWFQIVYLLSVFDTAFYSLEPLRFKAKPIQSMISFSGAVFLPGVASWTLVNDLSNIPPIIYFLGFMFLTYCTLKNLPDYEGDRLAGLRTSATIFSSKKQASKVAAVTLVSPFIVLSGLLLSGLLDTKYSLLFVLLPLVIYLGNLSIKGDSYEELERLHTFGLVYVVLFLIITLLITSPTIITMGFVTLTILLQALILTKKIDSR